ncbi:hypothetical protein [Pedobacter alluvionis]|uniref:Uncharacterized protein n=1 Tax=Pedobacter alluvionis TaxID=475253 RepID=A0A497YAC8_9SPHI|nr:hypothetical protein [Pedobacter alluvionis]RLJ80512.1 hypothetical protein BCL90_1293 [Pedobacter alluvionis]TFB31783.1 hypothetical protein E3V97_14480 [Pedobacter alluvionis]
MTPFIPTSHFFTDPATITQSAAQAFGPVSENEFNLTAKFTSTGAQAFAICKGVVLVQPQGGEVVNLILRPYEQPINGLNIRYFIYRGLKKSDFFSGENVLADGSEVSGFIKGINKSFAGFYKNENVPPFLAKYIGFDPTQQAANLPLDQFFFKDSEYVDNAGQFVEKAETAFELPMVAKGTSLGHFIAGECGIDVVLNYGDYQLPAPNAEFNFDLNYARAAGASISLVTITDEFQKKLVKEQITQFLDVAAFYGFHCGNGSVNINGTATKGEAIYTAAVSKFSTKNKLYLYIQSDRCRSYNFYGNYLINSTDSKSLKLGTVETTLNEQAYQTNGWPLLIDEAAHTPATANNSLFLQLVTDNGANSMLYGQVANMVNATKENFFNAEGLKAPNATDGTPSLFTKTIVLANLAVGGDNGSLNIASFNILIYQGSAYPYILGQETDDQNVTTNILGLPNFFDDVFDQLNATPLLKAAQDNDYAVLSSQKVKLISHYHNNTQLGISALQTLNINDVIETDDPLTPLLKRVTYITEAVDVLNSALSVTGTLTPDTKSNPSVSGAVGSNKTYQLPDAFYYSLQPFTDSAEIINGLQLLAKDGSTPNKIILGLTQVENDLLKALITTNSLINARLFLIDLFEDGNELISAENITYQKYKAGIVGDTVAGELKLYLPATDVMVYSIDRKYHYSKRYSNYMPDLLLDSQFSFINELI